MIVNIRYSQLSNRLALLAHVLATAIVKKQELLITVFDDLKDAYVCRQPRGVRVVMRASRFWAMEKRLYGLLRRMVGNRFSQWLSLKFGIVSFWLYRDREAIALAGDEVRAFFAPKDECVGYAKSFVMKYFRDNQVRIGVHIRRGDYREWQGGRYWYDDETYKDCIGHLLQELEADDACRGKSRLVIVFSDDKSVKAEKFAGEGYAVVRSDGAAMDDHCLMAKCNFLLGPPSTFTLWSSWYGKVPLCHIQDAAHRPVLADFRWNEIC